MPALKRSLPVCRVQERLRIPASCDNMWRVLPTGYVFHQTGKTPSGLGRKRRFSPCVGSHLQAETFQFSCEPDVTFDEDLVARFPLERVWSVSGLNEGIAPAEPNVWVRVRLSNPSCTLESLSSWRMATIVEGNTLYLCDDLLLVHSHTPQLRAQELYSELAY